MPERAKGVRYEKASRGADVGFLGRHIVGVVSHKITCGVSTLGSLDLKTLGTLSIYVKSSYFV